MRLTRFAGGVESAEVDEDKYWMWAARVLACLGGK